MVCRTQATPPAIVFECECGTINRSPDRHLPVGWSAAHGQSWCNDCTAAGIPARKLASSARHRRVA